MTKTDCIMIKFNEEAFNLLMRDRLKRNRENLG